MSNLILPGQKPNQVIVIKCAKEFIDNVSLNDELSGGTLAKNKKLKVLAKGVKEGMGNLMCEVLPSG